MQKQLNIWQFINNSLQQNIAVMLLYVLQSNGSSPGRQGFFMAVNNGGGMLGSIGGGIMEHKFAELAKARLKDSPGNESPLIKKQVHDKTAADNQSGMICSGEQIILMYQLKQADEIHIMKLIASLKQCKNGTLYLSPDGLIFSEEILEGDFECNIASESDWIYKEKTGYKNHLYIVGGGHCALALSQLMSTMDFYIHLVDDRNELPTINQNVTAHEKTILNNYNELSSVIPSGKNIYVVIMTVGYRTDYICVKALLNKHFRYFGVLGSSKKMEKLFSEFKLENIGPQKLDRISTPVGININSQTPEEIAVSIAAQIIMVKNKQGSI